MAIIIKSDAIKTNFLSLSEPLIDGKKSLLTVFRMKIMFYGVTVLTHS